MVSLYAEIVNIHKASSQLSAEGGLTVLYRKSQQAKNEPLPADFFAESCQRVGRPMIRGQNCETMQAALFRPDCGCWDCPYCARKNLAKLRHVIAFGVVAVGRAQKIEFVTLTSHEKLQSPEQTFKVLALAWNKLNRRFKRTAARTGATVYYVQVPEAHKSGRWHLHMLSSPPMGKRWWKNNARACGFGYQAHAEVLVKHGRAGQYMQKYVRKQLTGDGHGWSKSMRRVRHSNNWPMSDQTKRKQKDWQWDVLPKEIAIRDEINRLIVAGYRVTAADSAFS